MMDKKACSCGMEFDTQEQLDDHMRQTGHGQENMPSGSEEGQGDMPEGGDMGGQGDMPKNEGMGGMKGGDMPDDEEKM